MSDDDKLWFADAQAFGWVMPSAPWWKRLPVIRHIRAAWARREVAQWDRFWTAVGTVPTGYDRWVLYGIARGFERHE